jgi:putative oxygen-independent coproporphyrinogen III oxidase
MLNIYCDIPLTLYIHLPWCLKKCPYCDFNSHALRTELPEETYLEALFRDFDHDFPMIQGRCISSIFFGGGTPSLFSAQAIQTILSYIGKRIAFSNEIEITLEANPGTFEQQKFADFKLAGINRLSVGVQSFQSDKLHVLGRIHDASQAMHAIEMARQAGFDNINIDLMYGLSNQSLQDALFDLKTALQLNPTHLSWYQLTLEPNTLYAVNPPPLPEEDLIWEIQEAGQTLLAEAGFEQYEISAYARSKHYCKHNINYWEFGDYLGIGAGAHSKLTFQNPFSIDRFFKHKHPNQYLSASNFIAEKKYIETSQQAFEFMLNAMRLKRAIPVDLFTGRTGLTLSSIEIPLNEAAEKELLVWNEKEIQLTALGWRFMNDVLQVFG